VAAEDSAMVGSSEGQRERKHYFLVWVATVIVLAFLNWQFQHIGH
jgi:hypothetical protein